MKGLRNNKGFTMIELLVVIAMLGVLAAIAVPKITNQMDKPKKSRAIVEIKTMKDAMDTYYAENNKYPSDKTSIDALMQENGVIGGRFSDGAVDPWGRPYYIKAALDSYTIWSEGPEESNDKKDDIYTANDIIEVKVNDNNLEITDATTNSKGAKATSE